MTLTYKGYHLGVWALCVLGLYLLIECVCECMTRPVKTWGSDAR